jgi:hypothetical protein
MNTAARNRAYTYADRIERRASADLGQLVRTWADKGLTVRQIKWILHAAADQATQTDDMSCDPTKWSADKLRREMHYGMPAVVIEYDRRQTVNNR